MAVTIPFWPIMRPIKKVEWIHTIILVGVTSYRDDMMRFRFWMTQHLLFRPEGEICRRHHFALLHLPARLTGPLAAKMSMLLP